MVRREFKLVDGSSDKFWAIEVEGASHTVHYGRTGTAGQRKTKEFASESAAATAAEKLIGQKTRKGYHEVAGGAAPPPAAPGAPSTRPSHCIECCPGANVRSLACSRHHSIRANFCSLSGSGDSFQVLVRWNVMPSAIRI